MKYTTNLSYDDFVSKLKKYEKKPNTFLTLRGKYKNDKMIISAIYDGYYIPIKKSYIISFNSDNVITMNKISVIDYVLIVLVGIIFILLGFSMIFWYNINLLYIMIFFAGVSIFVFLISLVNYKNFIIKTLKNDFGFRSYKKLKISKKSKIH